MALCGTDISSTQVSRIAKELDEGLALWRNRPLGSVPFLILDARYEKVRHGGSVVDCAVLVAMGVRDDGRRTVLGVSCALSEAEPHWRAFLQSLLARGLHGVRMITSDDHADLRSILDAPDLGEAKRRTDIVVAKHRKAAPDLADWIDANVAEALTVLTLPPE
ncbi:MAG: transposase, partial [Phycisphaerae bacterium]|nr:transposase [Phycisphaerae bacterium]